MAEAPIVRIAIPNPFFEGATNVYVIAADPVTLVDTGIGTDEAYGALEQGLRAHCLEPRSIRRLVLTHHHLDHFGLARRLHDTVGVKVYVHVDDWEAVTRYEEWNTAFVNRMVKRMSAWGAPEGDIQEGSALFLHGGRFLARSVPAEPLIDGQRLPLGEGELEVIHTPGHSVGSICLRYGRHLFSGDHVLPDVSPNIGGAGWVTSGILRRYLASLERMEPLQTDDLIVYPGHGDPFHDLVGRVRWLKEHHREREEAIVAFLGKNGPATVYEIAVGIFGRLRSHHVALGTAEIYAHLEKLESEERLIQRDGRYHQFSIDGS
jgi:hydroxyacylglutathione hydrolase